MCVICSSPTEATLRHSAIYLAHSPGTLHPSVDMDAFSGLDNFWDISQHPSTFSTLTEDDFLSLLQKQFPTSNPFDLSPPDGIDPISISSLPIPNPTPPSTDSSPSPPSTNQEPTMSRRQSGVFNKSTPESNDDPSLKRKASDEDMGEEPTHKTVHTGMY